jgi:hypothetical protein
MFHRVLPKKVRSKIVLPLASVLDQIVARRRRLYDCGLVALSAGTVTAACTTIAAPYAVLSKTAYFDRRPAARGSDILRAFARHQHRGRYLRREGDAIAYRIPGYP